MILGGTGQEELRELSLRVEKDTGFDSIPTIEAKYERTKQGAFMCSFPVCKFLRRDPTLMWEHVLFGPHGRPLGTLEEVNRKWV